MNLLRAALLCLGLLATSAWAETAAAPASAAVPTATIKATEPFDLGEGLGYVRVHRLVDSLALLERTLPQEHALVVDFRYATATEADSAALATLLARRPPVAPLLLLVSPQTPAVLVPVIVKRSPPVLTLGVVGSLPAPTVVVTQTTEADRRAFDALEGGMPLEALITGKIDKERFDEAELVKEFQSGNTNAAPPAGPDPTKPGADKAPALTDRVLQRAVHLHRALLALKRS